MKAVQEHRLPNTERGRNDHEPARGDQALHHRHPAGRARLPPRPPVARPPRETEARLNGYPQFVTEIDGQRLHFLHIESPDPAAVPLLLLHGWPGTIMEFTDLIEQLTRPGEGPVFHLVIPSLPGFGFSGPTTDTGWGAARTAKALATLIARQEPPATTGNAQK